VSWLSRKGRRGPGDARQAALPTTDGPAGDDVADRPVPGVREPTPWPPTPAPVWPAGLADEPDPVKVVVTGPFAAGKTTFVTGVSQTEAVVTETPVSDGTAEVKGRTTVTLDFGALDVPDPGGTGSARVALFGTPGQQRFSFMWRILGEGMRVFVVLVDASRRHSRDEAREILRTFRRMTPDTPFVVAVNRWDEADDVDRMVLALGLTPADVPRLVRADARDRAVGVALLQFALQHVVPRPGAAPAVPPAPAGAE
jgi:small GTP-binding protein